MLQSTEWTLSDVPMRIGGGVAAWVEVDVTLIIDIDGTLADIEFRNLDGGGTIDVPASCRTAWGMSDPNAAAIWATAQELMRTRGDEVRDAAGWQPPAEEPPYVPIYGVGLRAGRYAA